MTEQSPEHRRWTRYPADNSVQYTANGRTRNGQLSDISASGAAFRLEDPESNDDQGVLSIEEIGAYETQVIRDMDDGFAVMLSLDEGEQVALQEELADYFHQGDGGFD